MVCPVGDSDVIPIPELYLEKKKLKKSMFWLEESIKEQFGINGIKKLKKVRVTNNSPFMQYLDLVK